MGKLRVDYFKPGYVVVLKLRKSKISPLSFKKTACSFPKPYFLSFQILSIVWTKNIIQIDIDQVLQGSKHQTLKTLQIVLSISKK